MAIDKLGQNAIADGSVDTAQLADDSVNSAKIGVDVIAAEDLASNSITVAELSDGAVTSAKLDTNIDIAGTLDVTGNATFDSNVTLSGDGIQLKMNGDNPEIWMYNGSDSDSVAGLRIQTDRDGWDTSDPPVETAGQPRYGFDGVQQAIFITNEQGTTNQAIMLNDRNATSNDDVFGVSVTSTGTAAATTGDAADETWTKLMGVSGTGILTVPKQPCFSAWVSSAFPNAGNTNTGDVILFGESANTSNWTQDVDANDDFSPTSGRFTAPVDGNYYFAFHMSIDQGDGSEQNDNSIALFKNGAVYRYLFQDMEYYTSAGEEIQPYTGSISAVMSLSAGDYVHCGVYTNPTVNITTAIFSGFLIG